MRQNTERLTRIVMIEKTFHYVIKIHDNNNIFSGLWYAKYINEKFYVYNAPNSKNAYIVAVGKHNGNAILKEHTLII